MTDLYNVNDTMKMIGNTPIQMMGDTKEFEEVKNIMKAFSEYGDDFEKVFLNLFWKLVSIIFFQMFLPLVIFMVLEKKEIKEKRNN